MLVSSLLGMCRVLFLYLEEMLFIRDTCLIFEVELIKSIGWSIPLTIIFDPYALIFLFSVSLIGASVFLFSKRYIAMEVFKPRFYGLLLLFIISIGFLIISPNLFSLLVGWDGLGISSFLLVAYFQNRKSYNASLFTALTNRLGDVLLLVRVSWLGAHLSWNIWALRESLLSSPLPILVLLAASTKRAQLPFSAWLPAAIAAPTPVSALVHSSTLVTAGVFLLFRFGPSISHGWVGIVIHTLGCLTRIIAGLAAVRETDMKKIVALSTLRQLGVIVATMGAKASITGFYHLLSHAYFKALLFIGVGRIIHLAHEYQDLRAAYVNPITCPMRIRVTSIAILSLSGLPFTSGFYSKDACLETVAFQERSACHMALFFVSASITLIYSARLMALLWVSHLRAESWRWGLDRDYYTFFAFFFLSPLAVCGGGLLGWALHRTPGSTFLLLTEKNLLWVFLFFVLLLTYQFTVAARRIKTPVLYDLIYIIWGTTAISTRWIRFSLPLTGRALRHIRDQHILHAPIYLISKYVSSIRAGQRLWSTQTTVLIRGGVFLGGISIFL